MLLIFLQPIQEIKEVVTITDVSVVGLLMGAIIFLVYQNKELKKDIEKRDDRIKEVIDEHKDDLKQNANNLNQILQKYNDFMNQMRSLMNQKS